MMKHLLKSIKYGMFTAIVATMVSCDLSVFYNDNYTIKDKVWAIDDKAVFDVDVDKEDISNS